MPTRKEGARTTIPAQAASAQDAPSPQLRLYNTLSRKVEPLTLIEPGRLSMYSCGPTVYRYIHIGNLRTFTMADWIRRATETQGVKVTHIKNITDVGHMRQERLDQGEDKMISQALKEGRTPWEIAAFYTEAFHEDERRLNILPAHTFPRATDHIPEMIAMTQRLLERGFAYEANGSVFFSVAAFPAYGELSGNLLEFIGQGQHTANEHDPLKRAPEDFPLWKKSEPGRLMAWESPWGRGFPGWHIECSAMSAKYLGAQFDLHTGGVDNIFPHHEDERAQSEAASGQRFVHMWTHGQHLLADGLKMAKSTGNAYTRSDVEARGFEPLALRYFFTTAKYRSRINFTFRALRSAQTALRRLRERGWTLYRACDGAAATREDARASSAYVSFLAAVNDDLNMPVAMSRLGAALRDGAQSAATRLGLLYVCDEILGFGFAEELATRARSGEEWRAAGAPEEVVALARERQILRATHDYAAADALRARVADAGYTLEDSRDAPIDWRLIPRGDDEPAISSSGDVPDRLREPDQHAFSIALLAHNSEDDLRRCVESVTRNARGRDLELVLLDNGSTDGTLAYLKRIAREGAVNGLPAQVFFADHDMGFATGRNAQFRASLGHIVVQIDTSIEVNGDIWSPIEELLSDPTIGLVGPYGLVTEDLKEFQESAGPDVDAIEGYLMAFRRETLREVGPADEKFRFYRLMDIDYSFEFKKSGYRAVASQNIADRVIKHDHREWYSLTEEERATKSKKNFDIFRRRRHHCESLLVRNYTPGQSAPWGHEHIIAAGGATGARFEHGQDEEAEHSHEHKHWPDHSHTHPHTHTQALKWFGSGQLATYVPSFEDGEGDA
ncbi:MAG TPA: cysteine--tRNA ligase [Ktedonobacterales bacterium]